MRKLNKILPLILLLSVLRYSLNVAYAAVPHLINYQGRLTDKSNKPLEGAYAVTFRIYDAENAGKLLWEETQPGVVIQKGIFGVLLGSVNNLNLPFDKQYFLEIKLEGEVMSPRQRITSAGYAIRAQKAEEVSGITNFFPASGNVGIGTAGPAEKLDIIGAIAINSKRIIDSSGNWVGSPTNLVGPAGPAGATGAQGPQGPQGPQGAVGPVITTSAACTSAIECFGNAFQKCMEVCNGSDKIVVSECGPCNVTSDTGSCSNVYKSGVCCVCKP